MSARGLTLPSDPFSHRTRRERAPNEFVKAGRSVPQTRCPSQGSRNSRIRMSGPAVVGPFGPKRGEGAGRCAERTQSPAPTNPIFCAERTQSPAPNEPNPPPRTNPIPRAERTRASASRAPRGGSARHGAAVPDLEPSATGLSKSTLYYRESGPARSPNPRRGAKPPPRAAWRREARFQTDPRPGRREPARRGGVRGGRSPTPRP
jgi:hypothetical protein